MTLLEVLIAFVIAAISIGLYVRVSGDGLRTARIAIQYEEALSRARSHLAAASATPNAGVQGGDDGGGFSWRVMITPIAITPSTPALYAVKVTVSWAMDGGSRRVVLTTQRLAPGAAAP